MKKTKLNEYERHAINELCKFAKAGDVDSINDFYNKNPKIFTINALTSWADCYGWVEMVLGYYNPLLLAAAYGKTDVVELLVTKYDADINIKGGRLGDYSPLTCAKSFLGPEAAAKIIGILTKKHNENKEVDNINNQFVIFNPVNTQVLINPPKTFEEMSRSSLNDKQKMFYDVLLKLLSEGFAENILITEKGYLFVTAEEQQKKNITSTILSTAGLLPLVGSYCTGANIINHIINLGTDYFTNKNAAKSAALINNIAPTLDEAVRVSQRVSAMIATVYQDQINALNTHSWMKLAEYAAAKMFYYIAANEGQNSTFLQRIFGGKDEKSSNKNPEIRMLEGLMSENTDKKSPVLTLEADLNKRWDAEILLTKSGITTPGKRAFLSNATQPDTYGFRYLPTEFASQWGKFEDSTEEVKEKGLITVQEEKKSRWFF